MRLRSREAIEANPCWINGSHIILHLPNDAMNGGQDQQMDINKDGTLDTPMGELGLALVQVGKFEEAPCELQKADRLSTGYPAVRSALGYALGASGNKAEARRLFQDLEKASCQRYVSPYDYSLVAIGLGEDDRAVQFLSEAADDRCTHAVWMHIDPVFDPIRSDPRYSDLLRRMGLPQQAAVPR